MTARTDWYDADKRLLIAHYSGRWTLEEHMENLAVLRVMADSNLHSFTLGIDVREATVNHVPEGIFYSLPDELPIAPVHLKAVITIDAQLLTRLILKTVTAYPIFRHAEPIEASTPEEAYSMTLSLIGDLEKKR